MQEKNIEVDGLYLRRGSQNGPAVKPAFNMAGPKSEISEISATLLTMNENDDAVIEQKPNFTDNEEPDDMFGYGSKRRNSMGKSKWSKYPKKYRTIWENDPMLKEWILRTPDDDSRVICRFCQCVIRAHKSDLLKHMATSKHLKSEDAFEKGEITTNALIIPSNVDKKKMKKKKLYGPDGSCFIVESEQSLFDDDDEEDDAKNDYIVPDDVKSHQNPPNKIDGRRRRYREMDAGDLTNKIGQYLMSDIEEMMRPQQPLSLLLRESQNLDPEKLKKMARICVGHLTKKYMFDSVCESNTSSTGEGESGTKKEVEIIEARFHDALIELQEVKSSFVSSSEFII